MRQTGMSPLGTDHNRRTGEAVFAKLIAAAAGLVANVLGPAAGEVARGADVVRPGTAHLVAAVATCATDVLPSTQRPIHATGFEADVLG